MDRTGDSVELLVEHASDFRMCDLLDEGPPGSGGSGSGAPSGGNNLRKSMDEPPAPGLVPGKYINLSSLRHIHYGIFIPLFRGSYSSGVKGNKTER